MDLLYFNNPSKKKRVRSHVGAIIVVCVVVGDYIALSIQ